MSMRIVCTARDVDTSTRACEARAYLALDRQTLPYRIAVDTGGTFSDVVVTDDAGRLSVSKASTTPERIFRGISRALEYAAEDRGVALAELLGDTSVFIYGTTRATNAIITGTTAR